MSTRALLGLFLGTVSAGVCTIANAQPGIPSAAIQRYVISERDQQCIANPVWHTTPTPAIRPFEITKVAVVDGPQYLVQGRGDCFCSPTGNCLFWVVVPSDDSFRILLKAFAIQLVSVLPHITKGHPDLELSMHDSAFESTRWTYQFDGQRYRQTECTDWNYQDKMDPDRVLTEPQVTPCQTRAR